MSFKYLSGAKLWLHYTQSMFIIYLIKNFKVNITVNIQYSDTSSIGNDFKMSMYIILICTYIHIDIYDSTCIQKPGYDVHI